MTTASHRPITLDLPHDQAWAAHAALMRHLKRTNDANDPAPDAVRAFVAVESNQTFDAAGLAALSEALAAYLVEAPERDRGAAEQLLATVEGLLDSSRSASSV